MHPQIKFCSYNYVNYKIYIDFTLRQRQRYQLSYVKKRIHIFMQNIIYKDSFYVTLIENNTFCLELLETAHKTIN